MTRLNRSTGNFVNYAIEVRYPDGPFVVAITHIESVATMIADGYRNGENWGVEIIAYDSLLENGKVFLGYHFDVEGAKPLREEDIVTDEEYTRLIQPKK